jgi:hypothetical protein
MSASETVMVITFARRGEDNTIRVAIQLLAGEFPGAHVIALATPVSAPVLRGLGIEDCLLLEPGRSPTWVLREAARRRPKAAAIVYSGSAKAHLKLEAAALLCGARRIVRCVAGEWWDVIGRLRLFWIVAGKSLLALGCLVAGAKISGIAWCCLRIAQMAGGGKRARRH